MNKRLHRERVQREIKKFTKTVMSDKLSAEDAIQLAVEMFDHTEGLSYALSYMTRAFAMPTDFVKARMLTAAGATGYDNSEELIQAL